MKKLSLVPSIFMLMMGSSAQGFAADEAPTPPAPAPAAMTKNPCQSIAAACMAAGYTKGGHSSGKGLVLDCVMPVATNKKTLDNVTFDPAVLQACQTSLVTTMKSMKKQ